MSFSRYALALLFLALPTLAMAQDGLELSIAPITTANKPLTISELIDIEVTLTNKSEKAVEDLTELVFDAQSIYFEVAISLPADKKAAKKAEKAEAPAVKWSSTFEDKRIHGRWARDPKTPSKVLLNPKEWKRVKLEKGKALKTRILMPLLKAGKLRVAAVYCGLKSGAKLRSKPVVLDINPKAGKKESSVLVRTNRGEIALNLFYDKALGTCHHFARAVANNIYNGTVFHRVLRSNLIQGGDPQGDGTGGPGFFIPAEFNDSRHVRGTLAMARSQSDDSAGCQFYITLRPHKDFDNKYTVFGNTANQESLDVVQLHSNTETQVKSMSMARENSQPAEKQWIRTVKLVP